MKPKQLILFSGAILIFLLSCAAENDNNTNPNSNVQPISPQKEYTKESPGEWEKLANIHIPEIEFDNSKNKNNIKVTLLGKNFSERHYIEVIGIMNEKSEDIDLKYFKRGDNPSVMLSLNSNDYDPKKSQSIREMQSS